MKTRIVIALLSAMSMLFFSCQKEVNLSELKVRMTDAPAAWEEVNIDLQQVVANFDHDTTSWVELQTNAGIYNLLGLQNNIDSVIAAGTFPSNQVVKEIRLVLGTDNTIKVDGQTYPLTIPSGAESGLKIKVNKRLQSTIESVLIDFDAALSISQETDGYKLRPVIVLR